MNSKSFFAVLVLLSTLLLLPPLSSHAQSPASPPSDKEEARREYSRQFLWGQTLLEEQDYSGAWVSLKKAVSLEPEAAEAWSLLGNAQFALGEREAAHQSWDRAKSKDPQWAYIIDKKLNRSRQLDELGLVLFEYHAQDPESRPGQDSPLAAAFAGAFTEKKIKISPRIPPKAGFPSPPEGARPEGTPGPFEVFTPTVIESFRQKDFADLIILVEAYSYLPRPVSVVVPGSRSPGSPAGADVVAGNAPVREPRLRELGLQDVEKGYQVEIFLHARVFKLSTGALVVGYDVRRQFTAAAPEEALQRALEEGGREAGQEVFRRLREAFIPRPDLVIKEEDLEIPHATLMQETPPRGGAEIRIKVRNQGEEIAYNFEVTLYEGAPQEGRVIAAFNVPALWPERTQTLNALWNPPALDYITLTALADVKHLVLESSLANNSTAKKVYILAEAQLLSNLYDYAERYQTAATDKQLLKAQKRLLEKPSEPQAVGAFLKQAVDKENNLLTVFGLAPRPLNLPPEVTTRLIARRNAQLDAQRWLVTTAALYRGANPQESKAGAQSRPGGTSLPRGAGIVSEEELPDGSFVVKMQAPLR